MSHHQLVSSITVGTDPEIFARSRADGSVLPAWEFLPPKAEGASGPQVFWDGVQGELSLGEGYVHPPRCTAAVAKQLYKIHVAAQRAGGELHCADVVELPKGYFKEQSQYSELGCSPSGNSYGLKPIYIPDGRKLALRFAGVHLHFGCAAAQLPKAFPASTVKCLDRTLGVLLTAMGAGLEDPRRRQYYGKPGEYRLPPAALGMARLEYRVPGSFLLRSPKVLTLALDLGRRAFAYGLQHPDHLADLPDARKLISACDAVAARHVVSERFADFVAVFGGPVLSHLRDALARGIAPTLAPAGLAKEWGF